MSWRKVLLVWFLGCAALACVAETRESSLERYVKEGTKDSAIDRYVKLAWDNYDFAGLEARYAEALASGRRTESGPHVASRIANAVRMTSDTRLGDRGKDVYWTPTEEKIKGWAAEFPDSVLPVIVLAQAYVGHAFEYRGGGYANTVAEEDWKQFHAYIRRAQDVLLSRQEAGRKDPNWWVEMLRISRLSSMPKREFASLAGAALDAFPAQFGIYFEITQTLLPQWGGSWEAISTFADQAVARTRATEGHALYARIYWIAHQNANDPNFLQRSYVKWPRIRAGFDDIIKTYPSAWNLNYFARMACDANDKATAKRLFLKVKANPDPQAWDDRASYNVCLNWAES
jgi:hypothetical protein